MVLMICKFLFIDPFTFYLTKGNIPISPNFKVSTRLHSSGSKAYTSIDIEGIN